MRHGAQCATILLVLGLLAGCATSPPSHFLVLDAVGPAQPKITAHGEPVVVGDVEIPGYLDRPEMVRREGSHRLDISNTDRWASPLAPMIREVLTQDLAARLPEAMLPLATEADRIRPLRTLAVRIEDFTADAAGEVVLKARWSILPESGRKAEVRRQETIKVGLKGSGAAAQADAMSRAIGILSDHIASALSGTDQPDKSGH